MKTWKNTEIRLRFESTAFNCCKNYFLNLFLFLSFFQMSDLKLDALTNRYLKSWLGMPHGGSFLPVHSGLGMDVESRSLDIVRALIRGDHTVQTTVQAKVQREQRWSRKSAISVHAAEIAGTILSSTEPTVGNVAVVEPPGNPIQAAGRNHLTNEISNGFSFF
jgi:hypothetical protein